MSKHTKGPWHVGMKPGPMIYTDTHGELVVDMSAVPFKDKVQSCANARRIVECVNALEGVEDVSQVANDLAFLRWFVTTHHYEFTNYVDEWVAHQKGLNNAD